MANIVKTYTMVNGLPADATQVNKNFDDIIAGVGDLTNLRPTTLPASDVYAWAKAATQPAPSIYVTASDTPLNSFDAENSSNSGAYAKLKSIRVPISGTYRTHVDAHIATAGTMNVKIYLNGISAGIEQSTASTSYVTLSTGDFSVFAGDTIEVWTKQPATITYYIKNFRLYGTPTATPPYVQA